MSIKWLRQALKNLEQAYHYVAADAPEAAAKLVRRIQLAVDQFTEFPMMGRTGRIANTRELVIAGTPYLIIYRVKGKRVEILRVLHSARKYLDQSAYRHFR